MEKGVAELLRDKPCLAGRTLLVAAMINQVLTKIAIGSLTDAAHWHAQTAHWHAQAMVRWLASVEVSGQGRPQHTG
jgi:hypothetical protein